MVDQGFYLDNNNTFLRTISSQHEYDKTAFILQNINYLILNLRDLVLSDKGDSSINAYYIYIMEVGDKLNPQRSYRKGFAVKGIDSIS